MKKVMVFVFAMLATSAIAQDAMTGDELEALLPDKTFVVAGTDYSGQFILKSDGSAKGSVKSASGKVTDFVGVWYIEGNQFCHSWDNEGGKEVCETWVKDGPNKA